MTPYLDDGDVRLYLGDCLEVMRSLPAESVDAVVTDPPYGLPGGFMGRAWDRMDGRVDVGACYHLSGLIDGEGCFRVQRHERGSHTCTFSMQMRSDDGAILRRAAALVGAGVVSDHRHNGGNPMTRWVVQDREGCLSLVGFLRRFPLRAKKAVDFEAWASAVEEWTRAAALKARIEAAREFRSVPWSGHRFQDWCREWAEEARRVAKPGAFLLAFGGTRTFHRLTCGIEDAGWEVRDCLSWLYGSGFAKSWNFDTRYEEPWCECGDALPYNHATATEHDLRPLRDGDLPSPLDAGRERGEVLLPSLPESGAPSYGAANTEPVDDGRAQPGLEGGPLRGRQGLRPREDAEPPEGAAERLCAGARLGRGGDVGPPAPAGRGGPSHQPRSRGQQAGEPDGLPVAPRALDGRALRDGGRCPRCGQLSQAFRGFGTGLKPSWEPVVLARKPLAGGTVAANVTEHGTGALNIDGCRVAMSAEDAEVIRAKHAGMDVEAYERRPGAALNLSANPLPLKAADAHPAGRWPANVALDAEAAAMLDEAVGERVSGQPRPERGRGGIWSPSADGIPAGPQYGDNGGPSRFFYTSKASTSERDGTTHPTVKPRDLMRWLVRLVTPPGGLVLDLFGGSGTTGLACRDEGLRCILIEREREYAEQAAHRLRQLSLLGGAA